MVVVIGCFGLLYVVYGLFLFVVDEIIGCF